MIKDAILKQLTDAVEGEGVAFDFGCGDLPAKGAIGVDYVENEWIDIVLDLEKTPYTDIPSNCAKLIIASHIVEHIKPWLFIDVMNEWWRILKKGGQLVISTPYAGSAGFWQDPTHIKGFNEMSFAYFDPLEKNCGDTLYKIYRPNPWMLKEQHWNMSGNLEILLLKRLDDPSYHKVTRTT